MAQILRTNGTVEDVAWKPSADNRDIIKRVFGDRMITTFRTADRRIAFADDEGLVDNLPHNAAASALYAAVGGVTPILGDVIVLTRDETRADEQEVI